MTAPLDPKPAATGALTLETVELTKRFGSFTANNEVDLLIEIRDLLKARAGE